MNTLDDILSKISFEDIAKMQPKEIPNTSLTTLKKVIEKLDLNQMSLLFDPNQTTKTHLIKIVSYLYDNDRKTFDYLNFILSNLPKVTQKIMPQQFMPSQYDNKENAWDIIRIHPLFRAPHLSIAQQFEPRLMTSSVCRFTHIFPRIDTDYYVVLSSPTTDKFFMNLTIESNIVVNEETPVTSFPIKITDSICEGYCHFRVSFHKLVGNVAFAIFPLEVLTPSEVEACIVNRRPHVFGGEWGFCPISHSLINVPVRGINCDHKDCFDLHAFISSSLCTRIWKCPICGNKLPFEEICIDDDAYKEMRTAFLENPDFALQQLGTGSSQA
ncbi:hypothetical protein TRFO_21620 [Tritrichomonas foetus]|uniref:SP-RING-type domain-containing protein n=1 Tax=Tritrichomonas foetus TaxID=1144522 RepID=A0A1J4KJ86_9EUKA|nr:hypothetical protein TRFO_21620 [Tritrichomonas foetus]|eukprot:OHT09405.1 hypothetical protein TRFO_21620 [Tritrichomonas foetus]